MKIRESVFCDTSFLFVFWIKMILCMEMRGDISDILLKMVFPY